MCAEEICKRKPELAESLLSTGRNNDPLEPSNVISTVEAEAKTRCQGNSGLLTARCHISRVSHSEIYFNHQWPL